MSNIWKNSRKTTIKIWSSLDINQPSINSSYAMSLWLTLFPLIVKVLFHGEWERKKEGCTQEFGLEST